jgi:hypothetical protein
MSLVLAAALAAASVMTSAPVPAPASAAWAPVTRAQIVEAMRAVKGYDATATTNNGRFEVDVLMLLAEAAERGQVGQPLFIAHEDWFQAFLEAHGLTVEAAPLFARLAREHGQDTVVEYRTDHVVEAVVKGPALRRALSVLIAWPPKAGMEEDYSFQDLFSTPTLQVTNHRQIRYRVLVFDDRVFVDQIEGLTGRPSSGALGLLFKVIGEGRVIEYRMAIAPDGLQISRGRAKKGFFDVSSTVTVQPSGKAEKDIPSGRADLAALDKRLEEPLEVKYRPFGLTLY